MKTLLVVADTMTRGLLKKLLAERGHEVEGCRDTESGWEAFNRDCHPLVVLQSDLPGRDGFHFSRCLRAHPRGRDALVLMLMPPGPVRDVAAVAEAGVDDCISTPVDVDQVALRLALLEARLERRHARAAAAGDRSLTSGEMRGVLDLSLVGVCFTSHEGRIVAANDVFLQLVGVERSELVHGQLTWGDLVMEDAVPGLACALKNTSGSQVARPVDLVLVRRSRMRVPVLLGVYATREGGGHVVTLVNLTEYERQHQARLQGERMEAMGQLARGIELHFNNLLTTVTGYSELLLADLDPLDPRHEYLVEIRRAGDDAAAVTRQLLVFSRGSVLAPRVLDLNAVLVRLDKMLRRLLGRDIEMRLDLEPGLGRVRADVVQLEKMLLNLVANARDAMPDGGNLCIQTCQVDLATDGMVGALPAGSYLKLSVIDTGHGMDPGIAAHIFEPFFSTRAVGRNMGLGLAVVFGVVQQSGGHIGVVTAPGEGARFVVHLPIVSSEDDSLVEDGGGLALPRGMETVLLVDHEASVRAYARMVLSRCGYQVLEASSVERAWRYCEEERGAIHLLVTNLELPGGDGVELAERLAALNKEARVLYVLSPQDDPQKRRALLSTPVSTLEKPFTPAALARKVRSVLDLGG